MFIHIYMYIICICIDIFCYLCVSCLISVGGVKCREHKNKFLEPDPEAQNNRLDMPAAIRFYAKAQEMSVPCDNRNGNIIDPPP